MRSASILIASAAFLAVASPAQAGFETSPRDAMAVAAVERISVLDDPLEAAVTLSSRGVERRMRPLDGASWGDAYLRAVVDRRSLATGVEIVQRLRFQGPRRDYRTVHYLREGTLERAPLDVVHIGAEACGHGGVGAGCTHHQEVAFKVDEHLIRSVAADKSGGWMFRIKDLDGNDLTMTISAAEATGFLRRLEDYRAPRTAAGDGDPAGQPGVSTTFFTPSRRASNSS